MSTTNLFHLEDSSDETESRDLEINLLEIVHRDTNFVKYRILLIEASIQTRDHDQFIIVCVLISVFRTHRIIRNQK